MHKEFMELKGDVKRLDEKADDRISKMELMWSFKYQLKSLESMV